MHTFIYTYVYTSYAGGAEVATWSDASGGKTEMARRIKIIRQILIYQTIGPHQNKKAGKSAEKIDD